MRRGLLPLAIVAACTGPSATGDAPSAKLPNIVIVFTDDQGWADVGYQGAAGFATPAIDRLARAGRRFTDFYVAQPVCSASRAALLTGCYPNRLGIHGALGPASPIGIHADETTLAELCKSRGYATAIFGKWHLGHHPEFSPVRHGFDEFYGIPYSNDMWPGHPENPKVWGDLPTLEGERIVGFNTDQRRFTGDFTRRACQFIERNAREGRPFFLYLAHPMPHVPLHVSASYAGSSEQGTYGDVIQEIDASVGAVYATLESHGLAENTLFVFTSDNGPWLSYGNHAGSVGPLREGKGTTFDGGVRVPCVMTWPGTIPADSVCDEPAMTIDLFPTIAELIGADLPAHPIDGMNILPLIVGEAGAESPHDAYYFWYHEGDLQALRAGRWKLHFPHGYRSMEGRELGRDGVPGKYDYRREIGLALFDLSVDIGESVDVSAQHPDVVEQLTALANAKRAELGDRLTETEGTDVRAPGRIAE